MYLCALRPRGESIARTDLFGYIARLKRPQHSSLHTIVEGPFAAIATSHDSHMRTYIARHRQVIGVGDVRLDNRAEIAALSGLDPRDGESDLQLVLAALDAVGEACIPRLLGDYAFVAWDARAQKLLAIRDAFGVKALYQRQSAALVLFSSSVTPLHEEGAFDTDFIHSYLAGVEEPTRTIWRSVSPVPAGTLVRQRGTVPVQERYWRAEEHMPAEDGDEQYNRFRFRELLEEAVSTRMTGAGDVWAQLSGGLDSSSIVSLAQGLDTPGGRLAGTVTLVDSLGEGDERRYSDAVVQRYGLRNEQVCDYWAWQDDGEPAPLTEQPSPLYPFHARDRRVWNVVRSSGARVLLSGLGADHYLYGNLDYITDLATAGRMRAALHELTDWSVATRQSFWSMSRRYLVEPFMPPLIRRRAEPLPPWLGGSRLAAANRIGDAAGQRFAASVAASLRTLPQWIERWPFGEGVEMRYPFLYRPLVEWSLRLPPRERVRPQGRKWILREATRDVLPETVRTRSTKGGIDARLLWSLQREKPRLDALLRDPVLGQLGCIDAAALRRATDDARRGVPQHNVQLFTALGLETWLAVQTGAAAAVPDVAATAA